MLTESEFIAQQLSLGRRIHEHDGVFWEEIYPFYCKPVFIYKGFDPEHARPARWRSLLGYSHQVKNPEKGNRTLSLMVLERSQLDSFGIMALSANRRKVVRRGLKKCEIKPILDLDPVIERMKEINISQSLRQEKKAGADAPVSRFIKEANDWREQIRKEFALKEREWIGAFVDGVLMAYIRFYTVEGVCIAQQIKAHDDAFHFNAVDALFFTLITQSAADPDCLKIVDGSPMHGSLNNRKEHFLFEVKNVPYYTSNAWLVNNAKRGLSWWKR